MRLWTIQPYHVYELMQRERIYRCESKKSENLEIGTEFVNAYQWISDEMRKRIGNTPKGVEYPVWAWYLYEGKNSRPDMRHSDVRVSQKSVLWEIEIPSSEVLLTDFDNWHFVLNNWINYNANYKGSITAEEREEAVNKEDEFYNSLSEKEKELYKRKSWEQIICTPETSLSYVQATFWELKASQIKKTWILKNNF